MTPPLAESDERPLPHEMQEALARFSGRLGRLAGSLRYFPVIGSTNDFAAALAAAGGAEGTTIVASQQTAGRGRFGRTWFSPPDSGLYVTVILSPAGAARDPERATKLVTIMAGAALAEGIEGQTGLRVDIKWPNDLMVGARKLAGILAEGIFPDRPSDPPRVVRVVLGYGINVAPAAYPPSLRDRATSLESELGRAVERPGLFAGTLAALAARYDDLLEGRYDAILDAWRSRARGVEGTRVEWDTASGPRAGVTCGIDPDGALLVRAGGGVERIVSGELRWACF